MNSNDNSLIYREYLKLVLVALNNIENMTQKDIADLKASVERFLGCE